MEDKELEKAETNEKIIENKKTEDQNIKEEKNNIVEQLEQDEDKNKEKDNKEELEKNKSENPNEEIRKHNSILSTFIFIFLSLIIILSMIFIGLSFLNSNDKIVSGIFIKGINVSGLNKQEAVYKLESAINKNTMDKVVLNYGEISEVISLQEIDANFDIKSAVNNAYEIGRSENSFKNNFKILKTMIFNVNIEPVLNINEEQLNKNLEQISSKLPDKMMSSSFYIEGSNLIISNGKEGTIVDIENMKNDIKNKIKLLKKSDNILEVKVIKKQPSKIDIDEIHNKIYKEPKDAYYTSNPFVLHPQEDGIEFAISIDEVKKMISEEKEEYIIPLKITSPKITTNMIGTEAFPDLLSRFSTKYAFSNKNRTTNLVLASNKIDGTVLMPGDTFSYNTIVGKRTIEAGFKEAAVFSNGQVIDGIGGGICQISSTLYNAVLFANLEITDRSNHMFIPSYVGAGRDATVSYGAIDFKFKNNRKYPIKLISSVKNGTAQFEIYGLRQEDDVEVELQTKITGSIPYTTQYIVKQGVGSGTVIQNGKNGTKCETYKILKKNGQIISTNLVSKDTYKAMNKLIAK